MSIFKKTDYKLLRHQKFVLLTIQSKLKGDEFDAVEGVIQFIDSFQDAATLEMGGASEDEVFGETKRVYCEVCSSAWIDTIQEIDVPVYRCTMCNDYIRENEPDRELREQNCLDEFITDSGN